MAVRVAINGFGRIGRLVLRSILEHKRTDIEVVAVNDLGPVETNVHLLKYDSVHGPLNMDVKVEGDMVTVGNQKFKVTAIKDPAQLPHKDMNVDIAIECTGIFTSEGQSSPFTFAAGAKRVLISAPGRRLRPDGRLWREPRQAEEGAHGRLERLVHDELPRAGRVSVLHAAIGIEKGMMTTIHSYTGDQPTLDQMHKDLYRGPRCLAVDDPDVDRSCQGGRLGACRNSTASWTASRCACRRRTSRSWT
jgi:glyceraldehyde 3-phosphate dehydrogenase